MSASGYLECTIEFEQKSINLDKDCVGAVVSFVYKKKNYQIHFPRFSSPRSDDLGHSSPTAEGTQIGLSWMEHPFRREQYGAPTTYNQKEVLAFSAKTLIVRSSKPITPSEARSQRKELLGWGATFAAWLEVLQYMDLENKSMTVNQIKYIQGYFLPVGSAAKARRIKVKGEVMSASIVVNMRNPMTLKTLRRALQLASTGNYPPAYYSQLISSLRHFNKGQYRQSLLDTATAIELALTDMLDSKFAGLPAAQRKMLMKRYRMLSGLELGLTTLRVQIPADIALKIGTPRNKAMHAGAVVDFEQAKEALDVAHDFIYKRLPIR